MNEYYEYFGPDYELDVKASNMDDMNSPEYLDRVKGIVLDHLRQVGGPPSVQMTGALQRTRFVQLNTQLMMTQMFLVYQWMISWRTTLTRTWWIPMIDVRCASWIRDGKLKASCQTPTMKAKGGGVIMRATRIATRSRPGADLVRRWAS